MVNIQNIEKSRDLVRRIDELRATGVSGKDAAKQRGITYSTYCYHKENLKNIDKKDVTFTTLPAKQKKKTEKSSSGKLAVIVGDADGIKSFIESYL